MKVTNITFEESELQKKWKDRYYEIRLGDLNFSILGKKVVIKTVDRYSASINGRAINLQYQVEIDQFVEKLICAKKSSLDIDVPKFLLEFLE